MIVFDGIIFRLQDVGGVSTYFRNILAHTSFAPGATLISYCGLRLPDEEAGGTLSHDRRLARVHERYRACPVQAFGPRDVFHSSYYRTPSGGAGKVVTTLHDFTYERHRRGPARFVHTVQKAKALKRADVVICVSHSTRDDLLQLYGSSYEARSVVIPHGVSTAFLPREKGQDGERRADPYLLFVGNRIGYKRFDLAVETVRRKPAFRLIAVGGGELSQVERQQLDSVLGNRYSHFVNVSEAELCRLYQNAFALLYPSESEGFGLPILEAMRSGCPVIARNATSIPEVAGDAALLAGRSDIEEYCHFVDILERESVRTEVVQMGLARSSGYSWERCAAETDQVYRALVGG